MEDSLLEANISSLANSKNTFTALNASREEYLRTFDKIPQNYTSGEI